MVSDKPVGMVRSVGSWVWRNIGPLLGVVLIVGAFVFGYSWGGRSGGRVSGGHDHGGEQSGDHGGDAGGAVWTCSMHPQIRQPKPGKCPICAMDLIRVEDEAGSRGGGRPRLTVSPEAAELMEVQVTPVERRHVEAEVHMTGKIAYDETRLGYITARVGGRIDRLYIDYTGVRVQAGDHMAELYSPDLLSAQEELLQAVAAVGRLAESEVGIVREATAGDGGGGAGESCGCGG